MNPRLSILCVSAMTISMFLSMTMSGAALAEIYQSTDADGNPVFTDSADHSKEAKEIDLGRTNVADPLKERAHSSAADSHPSKPPAKQYEATIVVVPNSYNENLDAKRAADRREQVLHADKREKVSHAE
jgi:hypothetical protein